MVTSGIQAIITLGKIHLLSGGFMLSKLFFSCIIIITFGQSAYGDDLPDYSGIVRFNEDPWPPYTYGESGYPPTGGLAVDLVNTIFNKLGVKTDMMLCPWKRWLKQIEVGSSDALMLLGYSPEREKYLVYSDPIIVVRDLIWFHKNNSPKWNQLADLKHLKFGRTRGFQYGSEFEDAVIKNSISIEEVESDKQNFIKLKLGRIDAFVANEITAAEIFRQIPELKESIVSSFKPLKEGPMYMGFSKKSPAVKLIPYVNKVIKQYQSDGTIKKIFLE